jgi:hypothetical protein
VSSLFDNIREIIFTPDELGSVDSHKEYVTLKTHRYGGALTSGRMGIQVDITPFSYCYAEIN